MNAYAQTRLDITPIAPVQYRFIPSDDRDVGIGARLDAELLSATAIAGAVVAVLFGREGTEAFGYDAKAFAEGAFNACVRTDAEMIEITIAVMDPTSDRARKFRDRYTAKFSQMAKDGIK
jgi:hypothetical protein